MKKLLVLFSLLLLSVGAQAATLKSLYNVSVIVESQSTAARDKAITDSFADLLVKITGMPTVAEREGVAEMLNNAKRYVRSFRYQQIKPVTRENVVSLWQTEAEPEVLQTTESEEESAPQQRLIVSFDEKAVGDALWKARLPVWGKTRPATLMWVAFQDSEKRMLIDSKQKTELQEYVDQQAGKRGLPIMLPRMDEADKNKINVTDVWGGYRAPLELASLSYGADVVASARLLLKNDNTWESRWSLMQGDDVEYWRVEAPDVESLLKQGVDDLAERISQRYVHVATVSDGEAVIYVSDVNNVFDYNRVSKYLNGLAGVKKAELIEVKANQVAFKLDLRSSAKLLKQSIALGKTLASNDMFGTESQESLFNYRLKP